jgi:FkbM family methyltransferase
VSEIKLIELAEDFSCYGLSSDGAVIELKAIYSEMFEDESYLHQGLLLPEDGVVLDVGANAGLFSLYVHSRTPKTRVLAFEPIPVNLEILNRNLDLHGASTVEVLPQGLGAAEGCVTFTFFPNLPGNSTRFPELKDHDRESISDTYGKAVGDILYHGEQVDAVVERLSTVLARYPEIDQVDLLKVDVEGAELDVLKGVDAQDWPRIRQVVLEIQDLDGYLAAVTEVLTQAGFDVTVEEPETLAHLGYRNVFAVRA